MAADALLVAETVAGKSGFDCGAISVAGLSLGGMVAQVNYCTYIQHYTQSSPEMHALAHYVTGNGGTPT
jgi:hypothetical protein